MLVPLDHFSFKLAKFVQPTHTELTLCHKAVRRLNELAEGDHTYLKLSWNDKYEIVKFTKTTELKGHTIIVERDIEGKGAKNFPREACVTFDWVKSVLDEYLVQRGVK